MSLAKRMIEMGVKFIPSGGASSSGDAAAPAIPAKAMKMYEEAAAVQLTIGEVAKIDAFLKELPRGMRRKALRKAVRQVAKFTRELAVAEAPEDTGQLVKAIKVRAAKRSRAKRWKEFVGVSVEIGEGLFQGDTFYAGMLEFGTKQRKTKGSGANRGMIEPNRFSFLRPALLLHQGKKRQILIDALRRWVRMQK